ncbi:MAG TPA: TlpA disulfide reductase family protein [Pyrinomonadaceae bacterium]|nr:TlpA disulfide reductase family protein [Pyrinomonadaceae bacterium]
MKSLIVALLLIVTAATSSKAQNTLAKLEGQVVCCAECWAEADRNKVEYGTAANLLKAKSCVEGGDPTLLAVREAGAFKLYQLGLGKFRLPGKNWLDFVGKRIAVEGKVETKKDVSTIRVDRLQVLQPSLAEREAAKLVGQTIDLSLKDLSGVEQSLQALRGRVVVLNFWATYCIPCRTEMPDLAAVQNEFAALGVQVIGVSTDDVADRAKVLQFVRETKVNFPIWIGGSAEHMVRFGLGTALPGTVVIDRQGKIAKIISGAVNQATLRREIESLLAVASMPAAAATANVKKAEVSSVPS